MKRILLLTLLALLVLAAGAYALVQIEQPGYVLVAYKSFRYESSLWGTLVLLASLWLLLFSLRLLFRLLTASGRVVNPWSRRNRTRRVQLSAEQGLLDLTGVDRLLQPQRLAAQSRFVVGVAHQSNSPSVSMRDCSSASIIVAVACAPVTASAPVL